MNINNSNRPKREAIPVKNQIKRGLFVLLIPIVVSGVLGAICAIGGLRGLWREYQLQTSDTTTTATVTELLVEQNDNDDDDDPEDDLDYYIVYEFEAQDRDGETRTFSDRFGINQGTYESTEIGREFVVVYVPANPNISSPYGQSGSETYCFGTVILIAGMGLLGFFGHRIYRTFYRLRWAARLARDGLLTSGTITDRWSVGQDDDGNIFYVAYRYEHGEPLRQQVELDQYRRLSPGDTVTVRYLPGYPYISRIEDL